MKRSILVAIFTVALATPSFADVTVKSAMAGKGMGVDDLMTSTTYIKGNKMRSDRRQRGYHPRRRFSTSIRRR